jgi:hypothetical protein
MDQFQSIHDVFQVFVAWNFIGFAWLDSSYRHLEKVGMMVFFGCNLVPE